MFSTIEVSNSLSTLIASPEVCSNLYNFLSYQDNGAYFTKKRLLNQYRRGMFLRKVPLNKAEEIIEEMTWIRLYDKKKNTFPTGLLSKVQNHLIDIGIEFSIVDKRIKPGSSRVFRKASKLPPLRYYQLEAIEKGLQNNRGIFEMATGSGKTNVIIELIYKLGTNTLVVVPSSTILIQFHTKLIEIFGKKHIGIITSGKKNLKKPITVATYQSLPNIEKEWFENIDCLIIDEAHRSAASTIVDLNKECFDSIYYRYYFTGTAYRNDGKDMSLEAVISDQFIYEYTTIQGIKDKFLVPIYFYIYDIYHDNLSYKKQYSKGVKKYRNELDDLIINNKKYNDFIIKKAISLDSKGIATIIFVDQIEHGEYLNKNIPGSIFVKGDEKRPINMQAIEDFNKGKFNILIGTSVIGEGVDTVRAKCGIIAGGGKAESTIVQKIGRLLRPFEGKDFSFLIDFTHENSEYPKRHFLERLDIYNNFCITGNEIIYKK